MSMLIPFDPFDTYFREEEFDEPLAYQSDFLANDLQLPERILQDAINRAINTCMQLQIPVRNNFRQSFVANSDYVMSSWELSPLACYLTIINCPPANEKIARAQLYFVEEKINRKNGDSNKR